MSNTNTHEGRRVPQVQFRYRDAGEWKETDSERLFDGKTVAVFSLPGAFTPTCSNSHLPRFNELASTFRANGVDQVICIAVNDPFVMEEWGLREECDEVFLLPDGNANFTEQMGMLIDKSDLNFGKRSRRYSMLVRDGVVERMFVEPEEPGDPFSVSDADTLLKYMNKNARLPDQIALLTREGCEFCARAKKLLDDANIYYVEINLARNIRSQALGALAKARTVPQMFVNGALIGDGDSIARWVRERLDGTSDAHVQE